MTTSRIRIVLLAVALGALAVTPLAAQTRRVDVPARVRTVNLPITEQTFFYARPIVRIGQDYTLKPGDTVRDVRTILADVRIEGHVDRDVVVVMGSATVSSTAVIEGSLVVIGGSATIQQGASVQRDFVVIGGTVDAPPDFSPQGDHVIIGTPMLGHSLRTVVPWVTRGLLWGRLIVPGLEWVWAIVGIFFLIGLAMNHVFDRQVAACASVLAKKPLSAFLVGLLMLLLTGPFLTIVAASIIGLAVVPFAIAAVIVAGMIGKVGVTRAIGRSVVSVGEPEGRLQSWRSFIIGFGVITLAYMVPVLGLLTWALIGVFGLGAATMSFAATLRREHPAPPPRVPPVAPPPRPTPDFSPASTSPPPYGPSTASAFVATEPRAARTDPAGEMVSEGSPPTPPPAPTPARSPLGAAASGDLSWYPRASFLDRLAAFALDCVLVGIANQVLQISHRQGPFLLILLAYHIAFWAWRGTTLGGIIVSLRVARSNGTDLRFIDAVVRGLSSIFSVAALGIGCFWMLVDADRQTWHDKIAGTVVVKVPRDVVLA